jgi:hypothetical protein
LKALTVVLLDARKIADPEDKEAFLMRKIGIDDWLGR